ncbi:hypothetical protein [Flavobacterium davisii]|uniref:Uncharacterized protein n=1 Tax=Flavobacterium columnare TaxID=996 RepID=A0A8G0KQS1_9FLAO|nr:hypothetical protein [Flavobacterium davisii]QYS88373.1 hypothetical protein JJC05_11725 [Flavobacterium davisii]
MPILPFGISIGKLVLVLPFGFAAGGVIGVMPTAGEAAFKSLMLVGV